MSCFVRLLLEAETQVVQSGSGILRQNCYDKSTLARESSASSVFKGLPAETSIERYVTIGAYGLLRSCTIEPECIIGQHSILMEGSLVETNSILEAGSVLPPGQRIPTGELWAGNPARFVRKLTHEEILQIPKLAVAINDLMQSHFSEFLPYSMVYLEDIQ
ncbi:putative Gamma carbonic anhydrase 1, mitochondrial [Cocos nucifera]|uniref:Putative Gamma carbonic anhydrase 1, mitochondrial n=1 Tax=Cocos nucifera TaxID=13894 RepID=A0A8K0HYS5_COCNU|nr:putative Gamma carbonic anhydrase 1, mitochondrial [Cocos nucifera]